MPIRLPIVLLPQHHPRLTRLTPRHRPSLHPFPSLPLLQPPLRDILRRPFIQSRLKLLAVPKLEQKLQPHEQRRQEHGLEQIIQQRRRTALEFSVPDELRDPRRDVCDKTWDNYVVGGVGRGVDEMVAEGGSGHDEDGEEGAGDGLEQDVEAGVGGGDEDSEVGREVGWCVLWWYEWEEGGGQGGEGEAGD